MRVHLRQKFRDAAFAAFAQKYPERVITEQKLGFPVDIIEANYPQHYNFCYTWGRPDRALMFNPLKGGISISNEWLSGYGTLGGIVQDRTNRNYMILSNWHVLAGSIYARPGEKILQPGTGDGGTWRHTVAYLARDAMTDGIDAAVAEINGTRSISTDQFDLGPVTGVLDPGLDQLVCKSGRTSGLTHGIITGIAGVTKMRYGGFDRVIQHLVHIAQPEPGTEVSAPGDSGSCWLEQASKKAVALHFAGSNNPEYGLAIAMPQVLTALNVDFIY